MKKIRNSLIKRIAATAISLVMVIALFPKTVALATGEASPSGTISSNALMQLDEQTPAGFDENTTVHPYGNAKDCGFLMCEESELYLMQSWNVNNLEAISMQYYDTFKDITGEKFTGNFLDINNKNKYEDTGNNYPHPFSYMEAVAFDPEGTGRRDHIAFVCYRGDNQLNADQKGIYVWVLNTVSGKASDPRRLAAASWLNGGVQQYKAANYFSITAGDYNGDNKDTLMVYVAGDNVSIQEVTVTNDINKKPQFSNVNASAATSMLHPLYRQSVATWGSDYNNHKWKLGACLTSGDLNGDGIDELAVLSYTNNIDGGYEAALYQPYLSVRMGAAEAEGRVLQNRYLRQVTEDYTFLTMAAPTISKGDVDNDGTDELVMAGYQVMLNTPGSNCKRTESNSNLLTAYLGMDLNNVVEEPDFFQISCPSNITRGSSITDMAYPPVTVECVAINGPSAPEAVFIGGTLFDFSEGNANEIYSADSTIMGFFDNNDSRSLVQSVAVGNFDGNSVGRQQVFFTYGIKNSSSDNDYNYYAVAMGGAGYNDTNGYGTATKYFTRKQNLVNDRGDSLEERLNCMFIAADRDKDGIMARFSKTDYFYSDPEMMAVLQAAPWFSDLGSWGDFQGGTSYGYSQSYTFGSSRSKNVSFSAGGALDIDAKAVEVSVELGYQLDWSRTFTQSQQTEYATTFTAGPYDLVLLSRTPIFSYYYDIYDPATGEWVENAMGVSVPQNPMIYRLTIDGYNDYVDQYNEKAQYYEEETGNAEGSIPRLLKLDDKYLHQEGNPFGYRNANYTNPGISVLSDYFTLGKGGGSAEFSLTTTGEQTVETEIAHGFHFHLSVVAGAVAKGGAYVDLNYTKGTGSFQTTGVSQETSCSVIDLNIADDQLAAANYDFNWQLCTWNVDLSEASGDKNSEVPVYGYRLKNLSAPPAAVTDLEITDYQSASDDNDPGTYTLTWTNPNKKVQNKGRVSNAGFNIYVKKSDGTYTKLNDALVTEPTFTLSYKDSYSGAFVVTAVSSKDSSIESVWSNEVAYFNAANGKSAYEIAVRNGFEGTEEEWLASLAGEKGKDGVGVEKIERTATHDNIYTYTIYFTNGSTTTFTVKNGADGRRIMLRADAENGYFQWQYDGDKSWTNLISLTDLQGEKGEQGEAGRGIISIEKTSTDGFIDTYTITYTDRTSATFTVTNGKKGDTGRAGQDGGDGRDGANGLMPYIGDNGNWWIGDTDTGKTAIAVSVSEITVDENGQFVFLMTDGTTKYAKMPDGSTAVMASASEDTGSGTTTRTLATTGLAVSSVSLTWNIASLAEMLIKRKKGLLLNKLLK